MIVYIVSEGCIVEGTCVIAVFKNKEKAIEHALSRRTSSGQPWIPYNDSLDVSEKLLERKLLESDELLWVDSKHKFTCVKVDEFEVQ